MNPQAGVTLGIPTLGRPVSLDWAQAYKSLNAPINYNTVTAIIYGKPVDAARNEIAHYALESNHKFLFFLGDDVQVPPDILKQLIFWMEHDDTMGVVGGIYCAKSDPAYPLVFRGNGNSSYWDWKIGELFEITGIGMDATLIRVDVFRELIKNEKVKLDPETGHYQFFTTIDADQFADNVDNAIQWTEDLFFCKLVEEQTNWKIYADGSMLCPHWDVYNKRSYNLPMGSKPRQADKVEKGKKRLVNLGCGERRDEDFGDEYCVTRVDIRDECQPDYRADLRKLPFGCQFDVVYSSHVLEHFGRKEVRNVLLEWTRILNLDGEMRIVVPNVEWAFEHWNDRRTDSMNVLYGAQTNPYDFHKNGFTKERLEVYLKELGFTKFEWDEQGYNLICRAWRK